MYFAQWLLEERAVVGTPAVAGGLSCKLSALMFRALANAQSSPSTWLALLVGGYTRGCIR